MFSRDKLGAAAREIADHLQLVDHVKALQEAQRDIADAVGRLNERIRSLEQDMAVLKAETKLEALKEAQSVVYAVQSGLNQRIEDIAVKVALVQIRTSRGTACIELGSTGGGTRSGTNDDTLPQGDGSRLPAS